MFKIVLVSLLTVSSHAFILPSSSLLQKQRSGSLVPRKYKVHEAGDDERSLLKLKSRGPVGYNVKKALSPKNQETGMNLELVKALFLNQAIIFGLGLAIACGTVAFQEGLKPFADLSTVFQWGGSGYALDENFIVLGVLGAIPALVFSNFIESSDRREFANVNFSTIIMVLTLFGRRSAPPKDFIPEAYRDKKIATTKTPEVLATSLGLSSVTGVCEETVFRLLLPSLLTRYLGFNFIFALLAQSALFGLGHAQLGAPVRENSIVASLQAINGLWFGLLYLVGGLPTSITAHAVFDFVVFFKTWLDANSQIEYADKSYSKKLTPEEEKAIQEALSEAPKELDPRLITFVRRLFYTFDFDKNKLLSLSEVRKGLSYQALQRKNKPPPQEQIDSVFANVISTRPSYSNAQFNKYKDRLDLADFIRLVSLSTPYSSSKSKKEHRNKKGSSLTATAKNITESVLGG